MSLWLALVLAARCRGRDDDAAVLMGRRVLIGIASVVTAAAVVGFGLLWREIGRALRDQLPG